MTELKEGQAWFYAHDRDAESWSGPHDTREEAIESARDENPHGTSYIGIGEEVAISEAIGYFDESLLEWMEEGVNDKLDSDCNGSGDPLVSFRDKEAAELELQAWAEKHLVIQPWYQIDVQKAEEVKFEGREGIEPFRVSPFPCCGGSDESPPEHTQDCITRVDISDVVIPPLSGNVEEVIPFGPAPNVDDGLNPEEADTWDEPPVG